MAAKYLNPILGYCVRTSKDHIDCDWINLNQNIDMEKLQDYAIPNDIISNYQVVQSTITNNSILVDDTNIFFFNHRKPKHSICTVKLLRAYCANADYQWENLLPSTIPSDVELDMVLSRSNSEKAGEGEVAENQTISTASATIYYKFEPIYTFHLDQNNEYSIQDAGSDENNHETFISLFTSSNVSLGLSFKEEEEYKLREWLFKYNQEAEVVDEKDDEPFLHGISVMRSKREDTKVTIHSLVLLSDYPFIYCFKSLLRYCLSHLLSNESIEDSPQFLLSELYDSLSSFCISSIPTLDKIQGKIYRCTLVDNDTITHEAKLEYKKKVFKMRIPLTRNEDEIPDEQVSLVKLLSKFRAETMTIFNAIMEEKNVLFFGTGGDKQSISSICFNVLSACLLVSPTYSDILQYRVFPYNTMKDLNFTKRKAYIAGMKHPDCHYRVNWDILCDCVSGRVIVNPESVHYQDMVRPKPYHPMDYGFISSMLSMIDSYALRGYKVETLETSIRVHFQEYTKRLVHMACDVLEFEDQAKKHKSHLLNEDRLCKWIATQSFITFKDYTLPQGKIYVKNIPLEQMVDKLRTFESISTSEITNLLVQFLENITTEEQVLEFLTHFPDPQGGLYPLAVHLLHQDEEVRRLTVILLSRIDEVPEGSACLSCLNTFLMISFDRMREKLEQELNHAESSS